MVYLVKELPVHLQWVQLLLLHHHLFSLPEQLANKIIITINKYCYHLTGKKNKTRRGEMIQPTCASRNVSASSPCIICLNPDLLIGKYTWTKESKRVNYYLFALCLICAVPIFICMWAGFTYPCDHHMIARAGLPGCLPLSYNCSWARNISNRNLIILRLKWIVHSWKKLSLSSKTVSFDTQKKLILFQQSHQ